MTSKIKVDNINKVSDDSNIINKCGTTITLGASGDTINLASGASQSGFGRTGTVDWDTTPKTATVTAASGVGYFVDTTSGSVTVNLPAGSAGAIVAIADYANTADTNKIVVAANGSEKIQGVATNPFEITVEGGSVTLVYVDSTQGWRPTDASTAAAITENDVLISATGGTITTSGDYKNFYEENGVEYSHILNPNSGKPILHNTKSVTVIHNNAMMADGWATALLALGSNKGLKIAEKYKIASLFILKEKNNFIKIKSSEFKKLNKN